MLSNVINWFSVTAVDCSLQVFVFVSASYTVYGKSKALVPVTKYSAHYLAALGFYGVLQNLQNLQKLRRYHRTAY